MTDALPPESNGARPPAKPTALFTLFDSEVTPRRPKLHDEFVLEAVLLYEYTSATGLQIARAFDLDPDEVERFFAHPATGVPSVARSWLRPVRISQKDVALVRAIVYSSRERLQVSLDKGVNYAQHTRDVLTVLAKAMKTRMADGVPGCNSMAEVRTAVEFYRNGGKAVRALLDRAEWPDPSAPETSTDDATEEATLPDVTDPADDPADDPDDLDEDGECEVVVETHDTDEMEEDHTYSDDASDDEVVVLPAADTYYRRASAARAWHFTAH